jgi:hypothetical protein
VQENWHSRFKHKAKSTTPELPYRTDHTVANPRLGRISILCCNPLTLTELEPKITLAIRLLLVPLCALAVMLSPGSRPPRKNISAAHHPTLAAAQRLDRAGICQDYRRPGSQRIDLAAHALKARTLSHRANNELRQAAETSNANIAAGASGGY